MKPHTLIATILAVGILSLQAAQAQQEVQRIDLLQQNITVAGKEVVQTRVDFNPGAASINHKHPGEEVAFVLEGALEYQIEGQAPVILQAGQSLFVPSGVAHLARNVGEGKASELATYIVSKGAPLIEPVK